VIGVEVIGRVERGRLDGIDAEILVESQARAEPIVLSHLDVSVGNTDRSVERELESVEQRTGLGSSRDREQQCADRDP
jgi:hypothetical protein